MAKKLIIHFAHIKQTTRYATEQMEKQKSQRCLAVGKIKEVSPWSFLESNVLLDLNLESNISPGPEEALCVKQKMKGLCKEISYYKDKGSMLSSLQTVNLTNE